MQEGEKIKPTADEASRNIEMIKTIFLIKLTINSVYVVH
jgi:hypothetical protein